MAFARHKRLLLARFAILAIALVLAGVVWVSDTRGRSHAPARSQLNGRTEQRFPIWAIQREGSVRTFHALWRARCTQGATWPWAVHTLHDRDTRFVRAGRAFSVFGAYDLSRAGRWIAHVTESVRGELSADRRTASGSLQGHVRWTRDGRSGPTCDSGVVRWRLHMPG